MKRIFGIASLIIALILGTFLSSQAQIVTATPVNIDGGFKMFHKHNSDASVGVKEDQAEDAYQNVGNDHILQIPILIGATEYIILEYGVNYAISRYNNSGKTDLKSGSYHCKVVGCKKNTDPYVKILN